MMTRPDATFALISHGGEVHHYFGDYATFDDLDEAQGQPAEMILAIPFRQALGRDRPISVAEQSGRREISALLVRGHETVGIQEFLGADESEPTELIDGQFDVVDAEYGARVRRVVDDEIRAGHGSNFVLHRTYVGTIAAPGIETEMSIFRSLLRAEGGAYWVFLAHFPDHSIIGASPEMHLRRDASGRTTMNPISGTYRYPNGRPDATSLRDFLDDPKERDELSMVVDEELKTMSAICDDRPWLTEPQLRFMSTVAHTEFLIHGHSSVPWSAAMRRSLVAPTVIGSPRESAYRMAQRHDVSARNYLGGVLAHLAGGSSAAFDSAILIRTACIESTGAVAIPVGSTIVRDSDPVREAAETTAKVSGVLAAFSLRGQDSLPTIARDLLHRRVGDLAAFWMHPGDVVPTTVLPRPLTALVIDFEDDFTSMLAAQVRALGLTVSVVTQIPALDEIAAFDLLVLGPGPGDPHDEDDPRIVAARRLARWVVETRRVPTLGICLSHQLLCSELGFEVTRLAQPNQGSQQTISLFGSEVRVGFYNSFSASATSDSVAGIDVARDAGTGEVYALRTPGIIGLQFHPESVLSVDGADILRQSVAELTATSLDTPAASVPPAPHRPVASQDVSDPRAVHRRLHHRLRAKA